MRYTTQDFGHQREPGPDPGIPCPACGADLAVSTFQESFLLICRCGRRISPDDVLGDPPPEFRLGLVALLLLWEDRLASLHSLSVHARENGFPNISAVMDRHIRNLRGRIRQLQAFAAPARAPAGPVAPWQAPATAAGMPSAL